MRPMSAALQYGVLPLHATPSDDILPLEGWRFLTAWTFPIWAIIPILATVILYLWGVRILHRRGDKWPVSRTLMFVVLGNGTLLVGICSFLGVYDTVLFWTHMVQHMLLNMIAPVFLVAGAPITLALRTLPKKPRKGLLAVLHSRVAKVLMFPPLTAALMMATPFALYTTGWYELTLRDALAHDILHFWMVVVGVLFFSSMLAVDPVPIRMAYPVRILLFLLTMPGHAFMGIMVMGANRLVAEEWYLAFERTWGPSPMQDQTWAGALLWATGDLTMFAAMIVLFVQWIKDSKKEARRVDRALDRQEAIEARKAAMAERTRVGYDKNASDAKSAEKPTDDTRETP